VQICWILKKEINENHFGVITPYRAQVKLTKELLKER
jgi:superfamily I DNA and/or RNA helicase